MGLDVRLDEQRALGGIDAASEEGRRCLEGQLLRGGLKLFVFLFGFLLEANVPLGESVVVNNRVVAVVN